MAIKFSEISEDFKIKMCISPQAVFVSLNPDDETFEQVVERQEKFLKLPEKIKDKLVAPETAEKIKNICTHYNLQLLQMAPVARVIRSYYFGEVKLDDFAKIIETESKIGKEEAQNIARYITERIINKETEIKNTIRKEKLTIIQAMEKYPQIKRQVLTSTFLIGPNNNLNPIVENWIADYFATVGAGNRDVMKRSSYLYHSKNARGLSGIDRQKLSQILKSLDEGFLLDIDMDKKEIIFNLVSSENRNNLITEININKDSQVLNQKTTFPSKKEDTKSVQNISPVNNKRFVDGFSLGDKKEEDRIIAKQVQESVAKLKDISTQHDPKIVNKKEGVFGFLSGAKKREEFDKKEVETINSSKGKITFTDNQAPERKEEIKHSEKIENKISQPSQVTDKKMVIKHVRGNSWDLGSAHFLKKEKNIDEISNNKTTFNFFKKKDSVDTVKEKAENDMGEGNIKFTFPQQLPVEKEGDKGDDIVDKTKTKSDRFRNFFGRIKPME